MFRMHIVDLSWTLEDILHQWPWTSSLVSSLFVMLTTWSPLSFFLSPSLALSLFTASHVQTDHLTPERSRRKLSVHLNAARSCWLQGWSARALHRPDGHIFFWTLCWRLPSYFFLSFLSPTTQPRWRLCFCPPPVLILPSMAMLGCGAPLPETRLQKIHALLEKIRGHIPAVRSSCLPSEVRTNWLWQEE